MPLVSTNRLHKFFGKNHVLRGIKLDVEEGEVVTIVGAIYFAICYPLSLASRHLERKAHAGRS